MSLFENDEYRWRETFFVLLHETNRPTGDAVTKALHKVNQRYQISDLKVDEDGRFESVSVISPEDYAAMDITFLAGEEVTEHAEELIEEMSPLVMGKDKAKLKQLTEFDARLDIYHFEQVVFDGGDEEEEFLDPGSLLIVLETLAKLTGGVGVDQESGTLL